MRNVSVALPTAPRPAAWRRLWLAVCLALVLAGARPEKHGSAAPSLALAPAGARQFLAPWSAPQRIPGYDDNADAPYLIADQNRTVHAFNTLKVGRELIIVYSQWTRLNGWTAPTDILLSPWKEQARIRGVFLDHLGYVHLIFFGGDDLSAAIFYSRAPLVEARHAAAWSPVEIIGEHAITPTNAAIAGDRDGNLYVLFNGERDGVGLYATYSSSGGSRLPGEQWTEPDQVYLAPDDVHWPNATRLEMDPAGRLHAVWTVVSNRGNGDVLYYARLDPESRRWSEPFVLATRDAGDYEVDWGAPIFYRASADDPGRLIVVYNDSFPATRWMRISDDGGNSWSAPILPFNYIGEYRNASFAIDSLNNLHMLLGNRTRNNLHGMWHSQWLGDRWSELQPVVSGARVTSGALAGRFDPSGPSAVISQGNVLLVTWITDPGAGVNGVWSSFAVLDAPELPVVPLSLPPTPSPAPTAGPRATATPAAAAGPAHTPPAVVGSPGAFQSRTVQSPALVLLAALIPSAGLILAVLFLASRRSRHSYRK